MVSPEPTAKPVRHYRKVVTTHTPTEPLPTGKLPREVPNWYNLPVRVGLQDVVSVPLSPTETESIAQYAQAYFDKAIIDKSPNQWPSSLGLNKSNPNEIGIRGEYAGAKYFQPDVLLSEFLAYRPWKMSDMGDAIFARPNSRAARVFDYKTRRRLADVADLVSNDMYMAEMDAKFSSSKYGYLQAFIFCVNNEKQNVVHLMGWLPARDFFDLAQLIPKGDKIPFARFPYDTDEFLVPYRRLRPIAELREMRYWPISESMTVAMRADWNRRDGSKGGDWNVLSYLPDLSGVPSAN